MVGNEEETTESGIATDDELLTDDSRALTAERSSADEGPTADRRGPTAGAGRPLWTYFLMPGAVVLGALVIAAAIVWVWGGDGGGGGGDGGSPPGGQATLLATFLGYAREAGLDEEEFRACIGTDRAVAVMNSHLQRGVGIGVNGTPTFVVNNKMLIGAQPAAVLEEIIDRELAGSPASLEEYSETVQALAASGRFRILDGPVSVEGAEIAGSASARVVVAEFSDFQCPFCRRWFAESYPALRARLGDEVALAFLHFPIVQIHPNAGNAGAAAICAGEQGKFWEMHDLLFERQGEWEGRR
jgi:protein-disulfide isomerase